MGLKANLKIDQGATFEVSFYLKDEYNNPIDLTGFTGTSKIKKAYGYTNCCSFDVTINEEAGLVSLLINAEDTAEIPAGTYVYDCVLTNDDTTSRIVEGLVTVSPGVTL